MFRPTGLAFRVRVGRGPQVSGPQVSRPQSLGLSWVSAWESHLEAAGPPAGAALTPPLPPGVTAHSPPPQDKEVTEILATAGNVVTLTIIPTVIYDHMVKK